MNDDFYWWEMRQSISDELNFSFSCFLLCWMCFAKDFLSKKITRWGKKKSETQNELPIKWWFTFLLNVSVQGKSSTIKKKNIFQWILNDPLVGCLLLLLLTWLVLFIYVQSKIRKKASYWIIKISINFLHCQ